MILLIYFILICFFSIFSTYVVSIHYLIYNEKELNESELKFWKDYYENEQNSEAESEDYSDADDERENEEERHKDAEEVDDSNKVDLQLTERKRYI